MSDCATHRIDVEFNHALADEAAAACDTMASTSQAALQGHADLVSTATADWRGSSRSAFTAASGRIVDRAEEVVDDLHRLAERIRSAADDATGEQRRRERDREACQRCNPQLDGPTGPR